LSYTFFTFANAPKAADLIKVLTEAKQQISPELFQLQYMGNSMRGRRGDRGNGRWKSSNYSNGGSSFGFGDSRKRKFGGDDDAQQHNGYSTQNKRTKW